MTTQNLDDFLMLVSRDLDGEATAEDRATIARIAASDPEAAAARDALLDQSAALRASAEPIHPPLGLANRVLERVPAPAPAPTSRSFGWGRVAAAAMVMAFLGLAIATVDPFGGAPGERLSANPYESVQDAMRERAQWIEIGVTAETADRIVAIKREAYDLWAAASDRFSGSELADEQARIDRETTARIQATLTPAERTLWEARNGPLPEGR